MQNITEASICRALSVCLMIPSLTAVCGCSSPDERVLNVAAEAAQRQAAQSRDMVRLQAQVVEGTKQLIVCEAQARQAWLVRQQECQRAQAEIACQHDLLEQERRAMDAERRRELDRIYTDPIVAAAIEFGGFMMLCLIPLIIAGTALRAATNANDDGKEVQLLVRQLSGGFSSPSGLRHNLQVRAMSDPPSRS